MILYGEGLLGLILADELHECLGVEVTDLDLSSKAGKQELARRIDNVMAFEKWKAGKKSPVAYAAEMAAALGKLRYGTR
mgnify:CR=1 FL=1